MERVLDSFVAASADGEEFTVIEYGHVKTFRPLAGGSEELIGSRRFALSDGRHVNPTRDPEVFEIFDTDQIIRKV